MVTASPGNVTATPGGSSVSVTWSAPIPSAVPPILGYVVGYGEVTEIVFDSTETTQSITGLSAGETYTIWVAAFNRDGRGARTYAEPVTIVARDVTIGAAGDIACDPTDPSFGAPPGPGVPCRAAETSELLTDAGLAAVLPLGDLQYSCASPERLAASYDLSWGRVKSISRPVAGNHEYCAGDASGYFDYFGAAAGTPPTGWYSYDLGGWHFVALNSNCTRVGGCHPGSLQEQWLRADLAANSMPCTLAYWHHPRWSSASAGSNPITHGLYTALYEAGADIVLTGHDHFYERFGRQDPSGALDPQAGIRQFIVGTGGKLKSPVGPTAANSEVRRSVYGVLRLTLHADSYDWAFDGIGGESLIDTGSDHCS